MAPRKSGSTQGSSGQMPQDRIAAGAILALLGDASVVLMALTTDAGVQVLFALHAAVVAILAVVLFLPRQENRDLTMPAIVLLAVAVAGPAGAAAALVAELFSNQPSSGTGILERWYERLATAGHSSPESELFDRIASGRVPQLDAPPPESFLKVIESGTLAERQKALGLVARRFHPDYSPVLEAALNSPEPVIRVQAAAVVARVRAALKDDIKRLTANAHALSAEETLERAARLKSLQSCTLADAAERSLCGETADRLLQQALAETDNVTGAAACASDEVARTAEKYLLSMRRNKDLRVLRRARNLVQTGRYRLRRIGKERAA